MSKRPPIDMSELTKLTSEQATPMHEAVQRSASSQQTGRGGSQKEISPTRVHTDELVPLSFKVPPAFRERYDRCAFNARLKLVDLLSEALDAWEAAQRH
jgi:hypothetical protein